MKTQRKGMKWKLIVSIIATITLLQLMVFLPFSFYHHKGAWLEWLGFVHAFFAKSKQIETETTQQQKTFSKNFVVSLGEQPLVDFDDAKNAIIFAKQQSHQAYVKLSQGGQIIWATPGPKDLQTHRALIDAPHIVQLPELPRGCEVTSLAMLLQYHGFSVDKMELAKQLDKDPTPQSYDSEQKMQWGNPYKGFVGDMYDQRKPGFGVFHQPVAALAKKYGGQRVMDLTGLDFADILAIVQNGTPVWVIVTSTFTWDNSRPIAWLTKDGPIQTTRNEHAVLLTGSNGTYVYFNDPNRRDGKNARKPIPSFEKGWNQMGKQAIALTPKIR